MRCKRGSSDIKQVPTFCVDSIQAKRVCRNQRTEERPSSSSMILNLLGRQLRNHPFHASGVSAIPTTWDAIFAICAADPCPLTTFYCAAFKTFAAVSSISNAFSLVKGLGMSSREITFWSLTRISKQPFLGFSGLIDTEIPSFFKMSSTLAALVLNAFQLLLSQH
mmetsp:Transcript_33654/g.52360  ORF Transcript_33654/g.52360 Transcript_33654/m.52360 type:complete len:165 (-) Transcript_33654:315-809(-)